MSWLRKNAPSIEALAALITALVAVAALIGVKLQLDAQERLQQAQSARDIYREFLALSIQHPQFAEPDTCALPDDQRPAYEAYAEYMFYTAEQVLGQTPDWAGVFEDTFSTHTQYICTRIDWSGYTDEVAALIRKVQVTQCTDIPPCP